MALETGTCYAQPLYVPAPAVTPKPYGIFSVADISTPSDPHWQTGVEWEPEAGCASASVYACPTCVQNDGNTDPAKTYVAGVPKTLAIPFTVYGSFACSPIGNWDRGMERAQKALENGEERAVENEIALGTHSVSNALTRAGTVNITPVVGTAVSVVEGLALLEQYIGANSTGEGVILASRLAVTLANANSPIIVPDGSVLRTRLGTPVAALSGFDGKTGPNIVAAAGKAWIYAIGSRPRIFKGDIFLTPDDRSHALSQRTNDFKVLAERTYTVGWDCFTVGVLVNSITAV